MALKKNATKHNSLVLYMDGRFNLNDVYQQIKDKVCQLSYKTRMYVLSHYDVNGKFIG